jgi:hypothetical protein
MVESLFQAVRNKLGDSKKDARQKTAVMLYGNAKFAAAGNGEEGGRPNKEYEEGCSGAFLCAGSIRTQNKQIVPLVPEEGCGAIDRR